MSDLNKVKIGQRFVRKNFGATTIYEVYDVTGNKSNLPSDAIIVYLKVVERGGWFNSEPFCITCPERSLDKLFDVFH